MVRAIKDDRSGNGSGAEAAALDVLFRALADPTRRLLLDELREGPRTTGQLVDAVPELSRFGVMKHLGVLSESGLVVSEKIGRRRVNHLNAVPMRRMYERYVSKYEDKWAGSLLSLKRLAERKRDMGTQMLEQPARSAIVNTQIRIEAPKQEVFDIFFDRAKDWFYESEETKDVRPTQLEKQVGGRFYMQLPDGGANLLAIVTMIKPGHKVRMCGDFTMPNAFLANVTIAFEDDAGATIVKIEHRMTGEFEDSTPKEFEEGWYAGLEVLKKVAEAA